MITNNWIVYNKLTGELLYRGSGIFEAPLEENIDIIYLDQISWASSIIPPSSLYPFLWNKVKEKRNSLIDNGISIDIPGVGIKIFDSSLESQHNVLGAAVAADFIMASGGTFSRRWTLKDNSEITLSGEQIKLVHMLGSQFIGNVHDHSKNLRTQLLDATTSAEILIVDIETGWPTSV